MGSQALAVGYKQLVPDLVRPSRPWEKNLTVQSLNNFRESENACQFANSQFANPTEFQEEINRKPVDLAKATLGPE